MHPVTKYKHETQYTPSFNPNIVVEPHIVTNATQCYLLKPSGLDV